MKSIIAVLMLLLPCAGIYAQVQTDEWGEDYEFKATIGVIGGIALINPDDINGQLEFVNNSLDATMSPLKSMAQYSIFVKLRPKIAPYVLMRIDVSTNSRKFDYSAIGMSLDNQSTGRFDITNTTKYSNYNFCVGIGASVPKMPIDLEFGGIYAIGVITETGSVAAGNEYEYSSNGDGYGMFVRMTDRLNFGQGISANLEFAYRMLTVSGFTDSRGRDIRDFSFNLSGFSAGAGLTYTF